MQISEIRKRHRKSSSSSNQNSKDSKKGEAAPEAAPKAEDKAPATTDMKAGEASEYLQKKRAALLSELESLDLRASNLTAEANRGKSRARFGPPPPPIQPSDVPRDKSASSTFRKPFTGIRERSKFVLDLGFDVPDADATLPEAKATEASFEDFGVPESERPELSLSHVSLLILVNSNC